MTRSKWVLIGGLHFNLSHLFKPIYIIVLFKTLRLLLPYSIRKRKNTKKNDFSYMFSSNVKNMKENQNSSKFYIFLYFFILI